MIESITSLEVDDLRLDLNDEGWATELSGKTIDQVSTYVGHNVDVSRYKKRTRSKLEMVAPTSNNLLHTFQHLQSFASLIDETHEYSVNIKNPMPLSPVRQHKGNIEDHKNPYDLSDYMMGLGWGYKDSINPTSQQSSIRRLSYERWYWHGIACPSPVSFVSFANINADWNMISLKLAKTALKAWDDFPNSIPRQDVHGNVIIDNFKTGVIFGEK
jgi:hypothetical protein